MGRSRGDPPAGLAPSRDQTHSCGEAVHRTRFIQTSSKRGSARACHSPPRPCVLPSAIRAAPSSDLPVLDPPSPSWSSAPGRANKNLSQFRFHHCTSPPGVGKDQLLASTCLPTHRLTQPLIHQPSQPPASHTDTHAPTSPRSRLRHKQSSVCHLTSPLPFTCSPSFLTPGHLPSLTICFLVTQGNLSLSCTTHQVNSPTQRCPRPHPPTRLNYSPTKIKPPTYCPLTACQSRDSAPPDPAQPPADPEADPPAHGDTKPTTYSQLCC